MRKQIAAGNWKMNCTLQEAKDLLQTLSQKSFNLEDRQAVILAVPFLYLLTAKEIIGDKHHFYISAQNCHTKDAGAYTGEVSAAMLQSCGIKYVIIGHSERREYFGETNEMLAAKVNAALAHGLTPIFCCGEALEVREAGAQENFVGTQIHDSLFHLDEKSIRRIIIAYEPIWAIGTGKTATAEQAQQMHAHIRNVMAEKYGKDTSENISILYGGSVKGENAAEIFSQPDVDGGLVGGASLKAGEFEQIIRSLKK